MEANRVFRHRRNCGRIIVLALFLTLWGSRSAEASNAGCRSDPLVVLSNGTTLDLSADIATALWDVRSVTYTLHIPAGLAVVAVVSTPSWPTTVEQFTVYADNGRGVYTSDTLVETRQEGVSVTANTALVSLFHVVVAAQSVGGQDRQHLAINVHD